MQWCHRGWCHPMLGKGRTMAAVGRREQEWAKQGRRRVATARIVSRPGYIVLSNAHCLSRQVGRGQGKDRKGCFRVGKGRWRAFLGAGGWGMGGMLPILPGSMQQPQAVVQIQLEPLGLLMQSCQGAFVASCSRRKAESGRLPQVKICSLPPGLYCSCSGAEELNRIGPQVHRVIQEWTFLYNSGHLFFSSSA